MSQAIQYEALGGPEVLSLREVPTPVPGPGEVLVHVTAAGVNPIDWKLRSGMRPSGPFTDPRGSGDDGAGVVAAVGEGVEGVRVGAAVAFAGTTGAYATDVIVPGAWVFPLPAAVTPAQGAAIGIPAGTAYQSLRSLAVGGDDTLLVHGGSGSVGQFAIQFARLLGARVVATSSPQRADVVSALGATPVAYGEGLEQRLRETAPDGFTVALDCAGTDEAIAASLALVADHARIATIVRGADAAGFGIRGIMGGSPVGLTATEQAWRREAVPLTLALLAAGAFRIELGATYDLADAALAQADSQAGAPGKLILVP